MSKKCYLGVDPGRSGAILAIYKDPEPNWWQVEWCSLNEHPKELNKWMDKWKKTAIACAIEKVHAYSGQGVKSVWAFGESNGQCIQVANLLDVEPIYVKPTEWQSWYPGLVGGHKNKTAKKNKHKEVANEMFNLHGFELTHRITDAFLITWWLVNQYEDLSGE